MVRGLFLMPMDGPSSPGGGSGQAQQPVEDRSAHSSSTKPSTAGEESARKRPRSVSTVAEIMAACEALEQRAKEMRELASRKPGEGVRQPERPLGTDGGDLVSAGQVFMTSDLIDRAAEMISGGLHVALGPQPPRSPSRIPRDDIAAVPGIEAPQEISSAEELEPAAEASLPPARDPFAATGETEEVTVETQAAESSGAASAADPDGESGKSQPPAKIPPHRQESGMKDKRELGHNLRIEFSSEEQRARLKVIGVGGAGCNAVDNMILSNLQGVDFIAVNTDAQALFDDRCLAPTKIQIGRELTRGLGAGGDPEIGRQAAEEDLEKLRDIFNGADMVFIASGMGGGTGSGGAPVIAQLARDRGILTIGIVTRPFGFEGRRRAARAEQAIEEMKESVDTLIVIPNDKVFDLFKDDLPYHEAFKQVDQVLYQGTKGISDIINTSGFINVDFADAKSVMSNAGDAIMGIGFAEGENRAAAAAAAAIDSPLLDNLRIDGARGILINITGDKRVGMKEVQQAVQVVTENAQEDADIYFGLVVDDSMGDKISVTVIATGFNADSKPPRMIRKVEPELHFHQHGNQRPLRPVDQHLDTLNGKNGKNGANGTNGHSDANGKYSGTEFVRVDADPVFVDETLADPDSIDLNDKDVPAFLRRNRGFGKGKR